MRGYIFNVKAEEKGKNEIFFEKYCRNILLVKKNVLTLHRNCDRKVSDCEKIERDASLAQLARARDL